MENKDLQCLVKIKDYHFEAAKKMVAYSQADGMRPNDKKHYEKRAKEHLDMVDVLQAIILAPPSPTTVDIADADARGYRSGRESFVVELPSLQCVNINKYTSWEVVQVCKRAIIAAGGSVKE